MLLLSGIVKLCIIYGGWTICSWRAKLSAKSLFTLYSTKDKMFRAFVRALGRVIVQDVRRVAKTILPSFISNSRSQTVIVCPPSSLDEVIKDFRETGLMLTKLTKLEQTFLFE